MLDYYVFQWENASSRLVSFAVWISQPTTGESRVIWTCLDDEFNGSYAIANVMNDDALVDIERLVLQDYVRRRAESVGANVKVWTE